ncbi:SMAD/FHA domain-containing protein [Pavlovales sp. CCMP2436]|nr:SMAD/FHA domain-containing protein [Pavlovales sp. CCMP2436]|mmetsp:Transcript_43985/g.108894  ORF Transcript_43985/g.108894 Transcript_43985/m.108894 type:complete len:265 (+) Transcript_43985:163-957(+)
MSSDEKWRPPTWCKLPVGRPSLRLAIQPPSPAAPTTFELSRTPYVVLGRQSGVCDVVVSELDISRQHTAIVSSSGATWVFDLKSTLGTFVDGVRVDPTKPVRCHEGAVLSLGKSSWRFVVSGVDQRHAGPAEAGDAGGGTKRKPAETAQFATLVHTKFVPRARKPKLVATEATGAPAAEGQGPPKPVGLTNEDLREQVGSLFQADALVRDELARRESAAGSALGAGPAAQTVQRSLPGKEGVRQPAKRTPTSDDEEEVLVLRKA